MLNGFRTKQNCQANSETICEKPLQLPFMFTDSQILQIIESTTVEY